MERAEGRGCKALVQDLDCLGVVLQGWGAKGFSGEKRWWIFEHSRAVIALRGMKSRISYGSFCR